jgi:cysteinyl-tRNA synthetase
MSKSLGNSMFVPDMLAASSPQALRYYLTAPHYRSDSELSDDGLADAGAAFSRIEGFLARAGERFGTPNPATAFRPSSRQRWTTTSRCRVP